MSQRKEPQPNGKDKEEDEKSQTVWGSLTSKPHGRQVSVGQDRRQYERVYKTAEECPPSEKDHVRTPAIESARPLGETSSATCRKQEIAPETGRKANGQLVMPKCPP